MIIPNLTSALLKRISGSVEGEKLPRAEPESKSLSVGDTLSKHNGDWSKVADEVRQFVGVLSNFLPGGKPVDSKITPTENGLAFQIPNPVSGGFALGELTAEGSLHSMAHPDGARAFFIDYGSPLLGGDRNTPLIPNRDTFIIHDKNVVAASNIIGEGNAVVPFRLGTKSEDQNEPDPSQWKFSVVMKGMGAEPFKIPLTNGFYVPNGNASQELRQQAFTQSLSVTTYNVIQDTSAHFAGPAARQKLDDLKLDPQMLRAAKGGPLA